MAGRRPNIIPSARLELRLPEDLRAKLDLLLWSEAENRVPLGRYREFFSGLLRDYFTRLENRHEPVSRSPESHRSVASKSPG